MPRLSAEDVQDAGHSTAAMRNLVMGLPGVDEVGAQGRIAMLGTRSIKTTS